MPTVKDKVTGDVVSRQPYTAEGTQRAEQIAESDQNWEIDHVPTQDGAARNVTEYAGGGNTGYAQIGQEYKEGGFTAKKKGFLSSEKRKERKLKREKGEGTFQLKKLKKPKKRTKGGFTAKKKGFLSSGKRKTRRLKREKGEGIFKLRKP